MTTDVIRRIACYILGHVWAFHVESVTVFPLARPVCVSEAGHVRCLACGVER